MKPLVFVVEDDSDFQELLRKMLIIECFDAEFFFNANSALAALKVYQRQKFKNLVLILCDLNLPDVDGFKFLEMVTENRWSVPVVFLTSRNSVESAVLAIKKGAFGYLTKPVNFNELSQVLAQCRDQSFEISGSPSDPSSFKKPLGLELTGTPLLIGNGSKMSKVYDLVSRVSKSNSNVLITGESGTGKEMVARLIHARGQRSVRPFVAINCSAIPDQLLESELFGHRRGSFTGANEARLGLFEEARGGTVFLDEIGDMPVALQAKILRVIQERKIRPLGDNQLRDVDVRIIAATHKNIVKLIKDGRFREDLFYRICVVPIHLPSLRERREDIPELIDFFIKKYCKINQVRVKKLKNEVYLKIVSGLWPGNVRELENAIERAVVMSQGDWIEECDFQCEVDSPSDLKTQGIFSKLLKLSELEDLYIKYVLEVTQHSKDQAAKILGINRKTLYRKELIYTTEEIDSN